MSDLLTCTKCQQLVECRTQVVPADWVNSRDRYEHGLPLMMVVLRNPGRTEDAEGKPAIGSSGRKLRNILQPFYEGIMQSGTQTDAYKTRTPLVSLYITNMVKCFTPDNRPPSDGELLNCREYIDSELESMKPEIVLLCGLEAQSYMFGPGDRSKVMVDSSKTGINTVFVPTYHPAARFNVVDTIGRDVWRAYTVWQIMERAKWEVNGIESKEMEESKESLTSETTTS